MILSLLQDMYDLGHFSPFFVDTPKVKIYPIFYQTVYGTDQPPFPRCAQKIHISPPLFSTAAAIYGVASIK